jgi:hypothetical protein
MNAMASGELSWVMVWEFYATLYTSASQIYIARGVRIKDAYMSECDETELLDALKTLPAFPDYTKDPKGYVNAASAVVGPCSYD